MYGASEPSHGRNATRTTIATATLAKGTAYRSTAVLGCDVTATSG